LNDRGVSNLHPERLKDYSIEMNDNEWLENFDDTHPFSSGALGQC